MSKDNEILEDFDINYRINESTTTINITLPTVLEPDEIDTGEDFEYYIYDNTQETPYIAVKGKVIDLDTDELEGGRIYSLYGEDEGRQFRNQPFSLPCGSSTKGYTVEEILQMMFKDTNITLGRGATPLSKRVVLNTDPTSKNRFCGSWNTKEEAINQLFLQYSRLSGAKRFRWYINYAGYFRWFETSTDRGGKEYIFRDDNRIISFKVKKTAGNIVNIISGTYGKEDEQKSITLKRQDSINKYGYCYGQSINKTDYTLQEISDEINKELDMKAYEVFSGSIEFDGISSYEVGTQLVFPDRKKIKDKVFTVVGYHLKGVGGKTTTTVEITTDESAISIPNEFDVIEAAIEQKVNDSRAKTGLVSGIASKKDDKVLVSTTSKEGYKEVTARNVSGLYS